MSAAVEKIFPGRDAMVTVESITKMLENVWPQVEEAYGKEYGKTAEKRNESNAYRYALLSDEFTH